MEKKVEEMTEEAIEKNEKGARILRFPYRENDGTC